MYESRSPITVVVTKRSRIRCYLKNVIIIEWAETGKDKSVLSGVCPSFEHDPVAGHRDCNADQIGVIEISTDSEVRRGNLALMGSRGLN